MSLVSNRVFVYFSIFILLLFLRVFKYNSFDPSFVKLGLFSLTLFIPNLINEKSKPLERLFGVIVFFVLMLRFEAYDFSNNHFFASLFFIISFQFKLLLWFFLIGAIWLTNDLVYLVPFMLIWRFGGIKILKSNISYLIFILFGITVALLTKFENYEFFDRLSLVFDNNYKSMQLGFFIIVIMIAMEKTFPFKTKLLIPMVFVSSFHLGFDASFSPKVNLIFLYLIASGSVFLIKTKNEQPRELVLVFLLWSIFGGIF